jgi:uncharacterized protein (DUF2062 family)
MAEKLSDCLPESRRETRPPASLFTRAYVRFIKLRGCPKEIARGFALGLFVGMSPTIGVQMLIAVPLAALLKFNKLAAAAGVWVSNPLTVPFIYSLTYLLGARIIGLSGKLKVGFAEGRTVLEIIAKAPEIFLAMTVGGIIAGLPLAVAGYWLSYTAITRYRTKIQERIAAGKEKIVQRRRSKRNKKNKGRRN